MEEGQTTSCDRGDFRRLLESELSARCKRNPGYSLRSFARNLRMDPSALSKILHGKRGITPKTLQKVGPRLGLSDSQIRHFQTTRRPKRPLKLAEFSEISHDAFKTISEWEHFAILELTVVEGFQADIRWIAEKLSISKERAEQAVERLKSLEMLEVTDEGKWVDRSGSVTTIGNAFTAPAFQALQKGILEKALSALELPLEIRDQTSMTMAVDTKLLPEARKKVKRLRRELLALMQSSKEKDAVFHLGVSLYPVTTTD